MKSNSTSVTWNVLASLLSIVLFGILITEGVGAQQSGVLLRPATTHKLLLADGATPPPQWPLPPPKAIA